MVTLIIFENHLAAVGLIENKETMTLQNLTTVDLFYSILCEDPAWIEDTVTYNFTLH
jgi:hypothetical protein